MLVSNFWLPNLVLYQTVYLDLQVQISQRKLKFHDAPFHHKSKDETTRLIHNRHDYLNCFTVPTVSQSPYSACTHTPRPLHGSDCYTVSTLCPYTDLCSPLAFRCLTSLLLIKCVLGTSTGSLYVYFWAATKQLYECFRPSVCPSVCHTYLTMFLSSCHHEIFRSY